MKVPKLLYDSFPDFTEAYEQIEAHLLALDMSKLDLVHPKATNTILPKIVFRLFLYNQLVLRRVLELSDNILRAWENKTPATAFILLRALNENVSFLYDANSRLAELIANKDFDGIHKLIYNLLYGTRIKDRIDDALKSELKTITPEDDPAAAEKDIKEAYTAQNILTVMDRLSKTFPSHRRIYEYMSEYSHPNFDALLGMYGVWNDSVTVAISTDNGFTRESASLFFDTFAALLKLFALAYDAIITKFNSLIDLSNADLISKGRSNSISTHLD